MSESKCGGHYVCPEIGYCTNCITLWLDQRNKLLEFVKRVANGCDGDPIGILWNLKDEAEEVLVEIGEK